MKSENGRMKAQLAKLQGQPIVKDKKGAGKGKPGKPGNTKETWPKGAASSGEGGGPVPKELLPGKSVNRKGQRLCFGYNLGTCNKCEPGETCDRGLHACTRPGCEETHRASECGKR